MIAADPKGGEAKPAPTFGYHAPVYRNENRELMNQQVGTIMDRWVFAYGSLMWNPGFSYTDRCRGVLEGYERAFCIYSTEYRGTPLQPGLTLGLIRGGRVEGYAYRVAPHCWDQTYAALVAREQATGSYVEETVPVVISNNTSIQALVFVAPDLAPDRSHIADLREQAYIISRCVGTRGSNIEYLKDLMNELNEQNIIDNNMNRIWNEVKRHHSR